MALRRRLLQDIRELQENPYPNIALCVQDDLQKACLLLTTSRTGPLHLTIIFGPDYPLVPPKVTIESRVEHPNIFGKALCVSILDGGEEGYEYTPAYTLKGIAIQLLSFFSSERIEQEGGQHSIELDGYRHADLYSLLDTISIGECGYSCEKCGYGESMGKDLVIRSHKALPDNITQQSRPPQIDGCHESMGVQRNPATATRDSSDHDTQVQTERCLELFDNVFKLPDEIILLIFDKLDTRDLLSAAELCAKVKDFMNSYDTIRMRELQCFFLKENFNQKKLGVGVHVNRGGKQRTLESEFDLLSKEAFKQFPVRQSIQGLPFEHWLPLPLSHRHWISVTADVNASLAQLAKAANIPKESGSNATVIYNFMNQVVVKLSHEADENWDGPKSTLTHASEKAVESYFCLFHLLLCLVKDQDQIVRDANRRLHSFLNGHTSKNTCPNLGHLLVAVLISDQGLTHELTLAIIKEAVLRNVVWILDKKGSGMAELCYLEPSAFSDYRLQHTFEASRVSYRLLMFLALFYRIARAPGKSIKTIRDDLFDLHGAPPRGTAESMAAEMRNIRTVDNFPAFFGVMGLTETPSKENFCNFLKRTIGDSVKMGYSCQPITQGVALAIRKMKEPDVEQAPDVVPSPDIPPQSSLNFFPKKQGRRRR